MKIKMEYILLIALSLVFIFYSSVTNNQLNDSKKQIKDLKESISKKESELACLKDSLVILEQDLNAALVEVADKKDHIKRLKSKLYAKADSISTLPSDKAVELLSNNLSKKSRTKK